MRTIRTLLLVGQCLLLSPSFSQKCGFDVYRTQLSSSPEYLQREQEQKEQLYQFILNSRQNGSAKSVYTIPIVFHIIHNNGPENVSDATVIQALEELNDRFQNNAPYFDSNGTDMEINFCLASQDPFGNPTTGITRNQSGQTNITVGSWAEDLALKNLNRWVPALYLNVWIVASLPGTVAGYANYPAGNPAYDGVVLEYNYLTNSYVLAHEVGHYLNLVHTFEGGCLNLNCLLDGDLVCDTPPDATQNTCGDNSCSTETQDTTGNNPFTSNVPELPNYMDYSNCMTLSFTEGQKERSQAALVLLRPGLLLSDGCGSNPGGAMPVAQFTIDSSQCSGTYTFNSTSTDALYTAWDFESDGIIDEVGSVVSHSFSTSGYYPVQVLVSGYGGSDTLTEWIYAHVPPDSEFPIESYSGIVFDPIQQNLKACPGDTVTLNGIPGMTNYNWSTGESTPSISFVVDSSFSVWLEATDTSGYTWSTCQPIDVHVNHQLSFTTNLEDDDTVACASYMLIALYAEGGYTTTGNTWYYNDMQVGQNQIQYALYTWSPGWNTFHVTNTDNIGCVVESDTFFFYVPPPEVPTIIQDGNQLILSHDCLNINWYHEGTPVNVNDSILVMTELGCYYAWCQECASVYTDTLCVTAFNVGMEENPVHSFRVFPNPASDEIYVDRGTALSEDWLVITDISGKVVMTCKVNGSEVILPVHQLSPGLYYLRSRETQMVHRFVKK